ncbi:hypothetical protein MN608_11892 [Microdochium nivale]|nr:hypothetical protein MN608_11892 [Microdochium nivale]
MIEKALDFRVSSKIESRRGAQTFNGSTPGDEYTRALAYNRFETFRTVALKGDATSTPTFDQIDRWLRKILEFIGPSSRLIKPDSGVGVDTGGSLDPAMPRPPKVQTITLVINQMIRESVFRWKDFTLSAHERSKLASTVNELLK